MCADRDRSFVVNRCIKYSRLFGGLCREYLFKGCLPRLQCLFDRKGRIVPCKAVLGCHSADNGVVIGDHLLEDLLAVRIHLKDQVADAVPEQVSERYFFTKADAETVSESHLRDCGRNAVTVNRVSGLDFALSHEGGHLVIDRAYIVVYGNVVLIPLNVDLDDLISGLLEFRCDHV